MLKSRIPQITVEIELLMKEAVEEGAETVKEAAKQRVPVRTGALRDAIHTDDQREGSYVVAGDTEAFYGHIVEHGSVRAAPHPFLVPALEENRAEIVREAQMKLGRL